MCNFRRVSSKFSKCCFYRYSRSRWLVAFSLGLTVLFLLLTSFIICHAILDCLSSTESLILLIWFCMYSVCSFRYMLSNPFCAFLSFRALVLFGFFLLHLETVFTSAIFSLTANVSYGTLDSVLCLVSMYSAAASNSTLVLKIDFHVPIVEASDQVLILIWYHNKIGFPFKTRIVYSTDFTMKN